MAQGDSSAMGCAQAVAIGPGASDQIPQFVKVSFTASSATVGPVADSDHKVRLLSFNLTEDSAGTVETLKWQDSVNGPTDLTGAVKVTPGQPWVANWCPHGHFETAAAGQLSLIKGASTIQVSGWAVIQLVHKLD